MKNKMHKKASILSIGILSKTRGDEIVVNSGKDATYSTHRVTLFRLSAENDLVYMQNVLKDVSPTIDAGFSRWKKEGNPSLEQCNNMIQGFVLKSTTKMQEIQDNI